MKTNIVGIIIALILTFVGMLSVYAQDTKVSEVRKVDAFSSIEITACLLYTSDAADEL